ncbi:PEP motif-containing protein, putative exosortase substrate [Citrifermentans bemidjiense Bem]|uniref:PEP motif-containing protein, putative exosortase substrate n=1 Tax=Citrifermentans bemidjiense (strain ATCC BAA-1014 / DSM 16622 / JCM 12645 / Bem) TaxID=404380 RepID=B5E8R4_CITBB|nr:PEP-CTERM sorting domain-containing protein [Citrifermentans bemidjiense]ACH40078.1 PEP motif-containing protein, putative exosortase substrate [Citrifermentans bemidjiense Bem]
MAKRFLAALAFSSFFTLSSIPCQATVVIDPALGWSGEFSWFDGIGPIGFITTPNEDEWWSSDWSISTSSDCVMPLVTAFDEYAVGDEFAFYFDNVLTRWTSTFHDGSGYFHGVFDDLALTAGPHTFTFFVTANAPGLTEGSAKADFSAVVPAAVPEPSTLFLLGAGFGTIGLYRWKHRS